MTTPLALLLGLGLQPSNHPHGSNLTTKAGTRLAPKQKHALSVVIPKYLKLYKVYVKYENGLSSLSVLLKEVDKYCDFISRPSVNCFSHQSDFVSSLLPELLCALFRRIIKEMPDRRGLVVTAQKDIVIECNFDVASGGRIIEKKKRIDVAILAHGTLSFRDVGIDFWIPALCAEVKTNIDKNMLSGIESSVETLKRTFPRTKYYAIGEYSDFEIKSQNYATTGIDEILIVRHQKRSAVRRSPSARNPLGEFLLASFLTEVKEHLLQTMQSHNNLASRLPSGRLI
jgi:hypothetical protein